MRVRRMGHVGRKKALEPRALVFMAGSASAIIALTLRTWIDFGVVHLRGTEADAMTSVGDGYFVIALAILALACTGALYVRSKLWVWLLPGIGVASVGIAAVAAYQAATPWHAAGFDIEGVYLVSGHATAAVYEVFVLSAAMGVVAAALASLQYKRREAKEILAQQHAAKAAP